MIDEWFEDIIDRLCDWAPAYFSPRMTRFRGNRFGWRMTLYASAMKRQIWGALTSIKWMEDEAPQEEPADREDTARDPALDKLDPQMRREVESWNDELKSWTEKQERERKKWRSPKERFFIWWAGRREREEKREVKWAARDAAAQQRANKHMHILFPLMQRIQRSFFPVMLLYTALTALGICAVPGSTMAYMAAACAVMWLAAAMEAGYPPVAGAVRQRYLAAMMLRAAAFLILLPMYFGLYLGYGVSSNVILQSTMLIFLFAHLLLTLALVAFNGRQPLFLRALSAVLGVFPALSAAAAVALAVTKIAMPPLEAAFAVIGALGAVMAFLADKTRTLCDIGGIRLRYTPIWTSFMMETGFLMMILGAWIAG